jgi:hypothetical protein
MSGSGSAVFAVFGEEPPPGGEVHDGARLIRTRIAERVEPVQVVG